jgi:hypothetical protein
MDLVTPRKIPETVESATQKGRFRTATLAAAAGEHQISDE